ncbi:MAG: NAD(P)H-hydrate dehydratase [Telluria sp.]
MHPLYTVAQVREIERQAIAATGEGVLMERAGLAAAEAARALLSAPSQPHVLVLAGPGNNGGDALEAAAHLCAWGVRTTVVHVRGGACSPEATRALERAHGAGATFAADPPATAFDLVIDGLFGIGLARPLAGQARALVLAVNAMPCPVLALDVPSGLDADTGAVVGPDGVAVRATHTITFIADKVGLHTNDGSTHAGKVQVESLDAALPGEPAAQLNDPGLFASCLQPRNGNSNKGSFGNVAVVGGARGMLGAPLLGARAALHVGAGRVYAAFIDEPLPCDTAQPEVMCRAAGGFDFQTAALVLGPGMGNSPEATRDLLRALESRQTIVLDADALNLVAASADLRERLHTRGNAIITPHPLEAARLLGMTSAIVQADRLAAAHELAERFNVTAILKGAGTIIAAGGRAVVNGTGNPGLATAGTGDVLAGMCGGLLAQGWPAWEAALGAVWIHGAAADLLVEEGIGPIGLTASELPAAARSVLNRLVRRYALRRS